MSPRRERGSYLPTVPSPLNPSTTTTTTPNCSRNNKPHPSSPRPKPVTRHSSPTLSHAQHILRAKAAQAWRRSSEGEAALCRSSYPDHDVLFSSSSSGQEEQDISDSPLSRAALDLHYEKSVGVGLAAVTLTPQAAVDLEHSLGLDSISISISGGEKASFGFLQPFTVDLTHVQPGEYSRHHRQTGKDAGRGQGREQQRQRYCKGLARRVLVVIGLLCLSYCLLPGMRYRATFRRGGLLAPVTS